MSRPASRVIRMSTGDEVTEYVRQKTGRLIPCPGEAHRSNGFADNCGVCAPRWGEVEELAPVDLDAARRDNMVVPVGWVTPEQQRAEVDSCRAIVESVKRVNKRGAVQSSYRVLIWRNSPQ